MTDRQLYIRKIQAKLDEWNADIDKLQAKADGANAEMHLRLRQEVEHLKQQREKVTKQLAALQKASGSAWDDVKDGLENSWNALDNAMASAWSRFK